MVVECQVYVPHSGTPPWRSDADTDDVETLDPHIKISAMDIPTGNHGGLPHQCRLGDIALL